MAAINHRHKEGRALNIREHRERIGLSQRELAPLLGVTEQTIGTWERGEVLPRQRMRRALAKRFRCTEAELFPGAAHVLTLGHRA